MRHFLFLFFLFSFLYAAELPLATKGWEKLNEPIASPHIDAQGVIEGVNVITGTYHEHVIDYATNGIDPQAIERSYFRDTYRPEIYRDLDCPNMMGWYLNYDDFIYINDGDTHLSTHIALAEPSGALLHFKKNRPSDCFRIDNLSGFMNDSSGLLSGTCHLKNAYIKVNSQNKYELHLPDGGVTCFENKQRLKHRQETQRTVRLSKVLTSGSQIVWKDDRLNTIAKNGTVLNWLKYQMESKVIVGVETSDQRTFRFVKSPEKSRAGITTHLLQEVVRPDGSRIRYHYQAPYHKGTDIFLGKDYPDGRYLRVHYDKDKVVKLEAPAGFDNQPIAIYKFDYHEGYTDVYDSQNQRIRYEYNQEKRITKVHYPTRIEQNVWTHDGCLRAKILMTLDHKPYLARGFHYDDKGNVLSEELIGNLTGTCAIPLELDESGIPKYNRVERYIKNYTYSGDEFNLLTSEFDGNVKILYGYVPHTNLLASKLVGDHTGRIHLRQFRTYDEMNALCQIVEDNGASINPNDLTGCSLRKIKKVQNRKTFPGVGQPEVLEEWVYDFFQQREKLCKRTVFSYDKHNQCIKEDVYDENGAFAFSILREYDALGRCVLESDALGAVMRRQYDANGNLIKESGPEEGAVTEYVYDYCNRPLSVKKSDFHCSKTTRFRYDTGGNRTAQIDDGGNETTFVYEGKRETQILHPPTPDESGHLLRKTMHKKYDLADRIVESIDEEGNATLTDYNVRGQPLCITTLTRGGKKSKEAYEYDLRGNCVKKVAANGSITAFEYDFLSRVVKTQRLDPAHALLAETSAVYNAFFLTSTTDAEGLTTFIDYDAMGRESKVVKGTACVEKFYDALGNLSLQKEWFGAGKEEFLIKRFQHDLLGRLTLQTVEDALGNHYEKKGFRYDKASNLTHLITYVSENTLAETKCTFDAFGREIQKIDPLGHISKTVYREDMPNGYGQLCGYKKEVDPNGNITEAFYDARGRVQKIIKKNALEQELQKSIFFYDGLNQCIYQKNEDQIVCFRFEGSKQTEILEISAEKQRKTLFTYNDAGELIQKQTPLTNHQFDYDSLGRVTLHKAIDLSTQASLKISYKYDKNGRLLCAHQNGRETDRHYDQNGYLISEKQESDLTVHYAYDRLGRRTEMKLPDGSSIRYSYVGSHLHTLERVDSTGALLYTHTYTKRDLSGRITQTENLAKTACAFSYDLGGMPLSIHSPSWSQSGTCDACGNLTNLQTTDALGKKAQVFAYSALLQLTAENDQTYQYDKLGNRTDGDIGPFNQLLSKKEKRFTWDEEGRLLLEKCSYDALNRMTMFADSIYTYDGLNRRIGTNNGWFLYDGDNEIGFVSFDKKIEQLRILGEGKGAEIGATVAIELNSKTYTPVHDLSGNITCLLNALGQPVETYRYNAFGEEETPAKPLNPWRFSSKRTDPSGLVFFGRRYYFPLIARWTTPDPIFSPNAYIYASNNPLTHYDLYGYEDARKPLNPMGSRNLYDLGKKVFTCAMRSIEWIGKNLIPIPFVRDIVESVGRGLSGGKFFDLAEHQKSVTQVYKIEGKKIEGHSHICYNGMRNTFEEAKKFGEMYSKYFGGIEVYVIYNGTNGLFTDLLECVLVKLGLITAPERALLDTVRSILNSNPNEIIHVNAHSQAGLHLYNAGQMMTKEERSHIEARTFGSAKLIHEGFFSKAINYVSKIDIVPMSDFINYSKAVLGISSNVVFVSPSTWNPLKEHSILGPTYQKVIEDIGRNLR